MMQASPQVTAAQVLDAGRRAEADGRIEYAIQFYRHLADHHSGAPEAAAARDALLRLKRRSVNGPEAAAATRTGSPPPLRASGNRALTEMPRVEQAVRRGPIRIAPVGTAQPAPPLEVPEPVRAYLTGRLIAHLLSAVGILLVLAGVLAAVAAVAPADLVARMPGGLLSAGHPLAGPVAAVSGIVLVFWSQLARAIFDIARSTRDLAAIERAKAEHANEAMR
ncbi:MAG: hypothetical protein KJZ80_05405 [Hyphomicrobiaceae bacterium]|nr:hypothetical protein [Hyphomicrobiaceae bacterium]